jgi:hypothetical protein
MAIMRSVLFAVALGIVTSGCRTPAPREEPTKPHAFKRQPISGEHKVEIQDGRFHLDGAPFYIRGVGYEPGCRPDRLPSTRKFEPELRAHDYKGIVAAGFNTLRNWGGYTDEELSLAAEYGLWVIQGIWVDYHKFWKNEHTRQSAINLVRREVARGSKHPNILCYLVMNEPSPSLLEEIGPENVEAGFRALVAAAHEVDPDAIVSYASMPPIDFISNEPFDFSASNVYPYAPESVHYALGYQGYIEYLVRQSKSLPFIVSEHGLSVSPDGPGGWGYGGNSLEEQADGCRHMYRAIAAAGGSGACTFMWTDGWWKSPHGDGKSNPSVHDPHPEEWFGFHAVPRENILGIARPVVGRLTEDNRLLVLSPAPGDMRTREVDVRAVIPLPTDAAPPQARLGEGETITLEPLGNDEWQGRVTTTADGPQTLEIRTAHASRSIPLLIGNRKGPPGALSIEMESKAKEGERLTVRIIAEDYTGTSMKDRPVRIAIQDYADWSAITFEEQFNENGEAEFEVGTLGRSGILGLSAGFDVESAGETRSLGDLKHFTITPNPHPEELLEGLEPRPLEVFDFASGQDASKTFAEQLSGKAAINVSADNGALRVSYEPEGKGGWIYTARQLSETVDLSDYDYLSFRLDGGNPETIVKVMLIDEDEDRWFQGITRPTQKGKTVVWDLKGRFERDPYGSDTGNKHFDRDRITGIAVVMTGGSKSNVRFSDMRVWR